VSAGLALGALKKPELLPLAYLVLTSSVIEYNQAPSISIGFGTLYLTDLALLLSLGIITMRFIKEPDFKIVRTPLDFPLLIFLGASAISTFIAILGSSLPWKQSVGPARGVASYLTFFVVTNLVRDKRQLMLLIRGFLLLATFVALVTIAQHLFAQSNIFTVGRVETAEVSGKEISDVTRVVPPGQSMIMVGLAAAFAAFVFERAGALRFLQLGILALGLMVTFFRASWATTGLTILITGLMARGQERKRLIVFGLMTALLVAIVTTAVLGRPGSHGAKLLNTAFDRVLTLFDSRTYEDPNSSLRWRDFEYRYAIPHILSNPFIGIGEGAYYRPWTPGKDWVGKDNAEFDGRSWVHNGHVGILLKTGIFGYVGLMWFMVAVLVRGLRCWRRIPDPFIRGVVLAFALTSPAVLIVCIVEPYLTIDGWTPTIGVIAAINEIAPRLFPREPSA
jgi:hypothetical protein